MKKLLCIDSDGCAIDSMNTKHRLCFGPALYEVWNFSLPEEEVQRRWEKINLFSAQRGINRFAGAAAILQQVESSVPPQQVEEFVRWTARAEELSNGAVEKCVRDGAPPVFRQALEWSRRVNEKISALPMAHPFANVADCLAGAADAADVVVVSSANREAILQEWKAGGLDGYVRRYYSQNDGSKAQCIACAKAEGYAAGDILMIGDAPGDWKAARANGVWFYPILAGKEEQSWRELGRQALPDFLRGHWTPRRQEELVARMMANLGE